MQFSNPYLLNLLWILLPLSCIMVYGILQRKKILEKFAAIEILPVIVPKFDQSRYWIKAFLLLTAFLFAIIALAGPQMGFKWQKTTQKGVDIMVALDCSKSMLAQDIKPDRLERAKREIIDLLRMMKSDRAGLVAFSGKAILQCPLTLDHGTFNIFLKVLKPDFLPVGGTNLGEAIQECYKGFEENSDTQKAIIIITDGESTSGDVEAIATKMAKEGIKIFSIGVGDIAGAPIPDDKGGFIKDEKGNIILSKVDETKLKKIADLTGGLYVRSVAGDMDLDRIYKDQILGTMERKTLTSGKKKVWEKRFQWFLFPCVILLLIELILSSKRKRNSLVGFIFAVSLSLSWFYNPSIVQAKTVSSSVKEGITAFEEQNYEQAKKHFIDAQLENPENKKLYYNIGTAAYMNKEYDQAKTNFKHALESKDKNFRHNVRYNLANTHFRLGNLEDSIKEYENILNEFPEDTKTKENLEFVKKKKEEKEEQKKQDNKDNKDKQDNKDKDQDENKDKNKDKNQDQKDQDQKDQDQKDQQDKEKSKKDQDQDKAEKPSQPDQKQNEQNKPEEQNKSDKQNNPDEQNKSGEQNKVSKKENQDEEQKAENQNMENMLNRLEDKPGKAMMPQFQKQYIEKDW